MQIPKEIKLSDVLDEIARGSNLDQALHLIAQKATVDLKAQACKIWVVKHGDICERCPLAGICANRQMCLHLAATAGAAAEREYPRIPLSVLNTSLIVRGGVSDFRENNGAGDKLFGIQKSAYTTGTPSYALYPLKGISGTVGLIGVFNDRLIDQDELQILAQLAPAAVAAIRVAELLARCDSLRYQLERSAPGDGGGNSELEEANRRLADELSQSHAERESLTRAKNEVEQRATELEAENRTLQENLQRLSAARTSAEQEALEAAKKELDMDESNRPHFAAGAAADSRVNAANDSGAVAEMGAEAISQSGGNAQAFVHAEVGMPVRAAAESDEARLMAEARLSLLEETNAELRDYNTSLVESVENLEGSLRLAEDKRGQLEEERVKLEETVTDLTEALERLRDDQTRLSEERGELAEERERLTEEVYRLRQQNDELAGESARAAELETRLQESLEAASRLRELEQENSELREANANLEGAVNEVEAMVRRLEEMTTNLRSRTELSERLCEEMEQRNRGLAEENRLLAARELAESRLLASLSHELRTPMNSIIGFTSLLLDDDSLGLSEQHRHSLERVARNARDMAEFLNQVLNYSKIEAGRMDVYSEPLQVQEVVDRAIGVAEGLIEGRPVTIRADIEEGLPSVRTDRVKLQQILLNLLSNAVKFTERGTITVGASRAGRDHVRISVSDTGTGIAEKDLPKIFEEFRQVGSRNPSSRSGVGLGLAITRRLAVLLEGEIAVSSRLGEGSVFVVTLPLEIESREAPSAEHEARALDPERTALVAGADAAMLYLTRKYLTEAGYSVATTEDGAHALSLVHMAKPALIVIDLDASADATDLLSRLATHKDGGRLIACSANADLERRAVSAGADVFLLKPVGRGELLAALDAATRQSPACVLVVDDDQDSLEIVSRMLTSRGYDVRTATDGREALERLAEERPAAIVLDLMLPEMDGFEVTHRLRLNPDWRDIPVILLTARDLSNEERDALDHGATRVLLKSSFSRDELIQEIQSAIGGA